MQYPGHTSIHEDGRKYSVPLCLGIRPLINQVVETIIPVDYVNLVVNICQPI